MAQREIGLAAGEPPSQKGYTPSVFNLLPEDSGARRQLSEGLHHRLLHRAGGRRRFQRAHLRRRARHSGRAHHSLAAPGGRRALSGHRRLELHQPSRFAAVDTGPPGGRAQRFASALAAYEESKDLIELGAYVSGTNPRLDAAVRMQPEIAEFLRQDTSADAPLDDSVARLVSIAKRL